MISRFQIIQKGNSSVRTAVDQKNSSLHNSEHGLTHRLESWMKQFQKKINLIETYFLTYF